MSPSASSITQLGTAGALQAQATLFANAVVSSAKADFLTAKLKLTNAIKTSVDDFVHSSFVSTVVTGAFLNPVISILSLADNQIVEVGKDLFLLWQDKFQNDPYGIKSDFQALRTNCSQSATHYECVENALVVSTAVLVSGLDVVADPRLYSVTSFPFGCATKSTFCLVFAVSRTHTHVGDIEFLALPMLLHPISKVKSVIQFEALEHIEPSA
jgi:hypothetical protein